jgi:hypothetical protein
MRAANGCAGQTTTDCLTSVEPLLKGNMLTLDMCRGAPSPLPLPPVHLDGARALFADLLPPVNDLLTSRFEPHVRCGLKYLVLLLTSFGKIIKGMR